MTRIQGQSPEAQAARLARGCCPIHGLDMGQVSGWYETTLQPRFTVVKCPRKDCNEAFKAQGIESLAMGPFTKLSAEDYDVLMAAEARVTYFLRSMAQLMDERDKAREAAR